MSEQLTKTALDPRIRRTRKLLQRALSTLLADKSFSDISITDICNEAEIARVTFYQHYDSKEALLLAEVADFFTSMYEAVDQDALDHFFETGEMGTLLSAQQIDLADPSRVRLVGVALQYAGSAVRKLTIESFLKTFAQHETNLDEQEIVVLATFYVGGILTLLEQFLNGRLPITPLAFQAAPLTLLRILRQGAIQSGIFPD
ncbi:TetR/AcrR family transcriptional regulator [Candidatus Leptofilum sp.]|uniref:TetR/AcrR family transcriptional regulator n=1 Tax=Candidatus Leptofilum sp. TaxID=3241576 RepID=UPI003B5B8834